MPHEWIEGARIDHDRLAMLARMGIGGDAIMLLIDAASSSFVEVSPAAERFYGWTRDQFLQLSIRDINPSPHADESMRMSASVRAGQVFVHEVRHSTASGEVRDVEVHARPIRIGTRDYVVGTVYDLRERRQTLAALEASQERYRKLVELSPDPLFVVVDGTFAYLNPAGVHLFGADESADLIGLQVIDFIHEEHRQAFSDRLARVESGTDDPSPGRRKYLRKDGSAVEVESRVVRIDFEGKPGAQVLARDVGQRVTEEAVLAWNAAIVESSDDAIYSEDIEGTVLNWNRAAERIYGFTADEIVGRNVYDTLIPTDLAEDNRDRLRRMWLEDRPEHFETVRLRNGGTTIDVAVTLSPIHNRSGLVIGISAIGRDISERKHLEQAKDEFLSIVSHELRSPLTTIIGYSQLLADKEREFDDALRRQVGQKMHRRANEMLALVEEILDATRLSSVGMTLQRQAMDPLGMLSGIAESLPEAERLRIQLVSDTTVKPVVCDPRWLSIAVGNLIGNALKFSPTTEPVLVEVSQEPDGTTFFVHDNGPGLDPELGEHLFDRFVQGDMSSTRLHEGVGLGLYIAKRIAEMHDGQISGRMRESGGSTFAITVPWM